MVVVALHQPVLERIGLASLDQVRSFQGALVKNHRGRRDVLRIETTDADDRPLVLFLKRNLLPYRKDGLASLWRRGRVWSAARVEFENGRCLLQHGIPAARPVAFGESCGRLWERFSFVITEAATGSETLDVFLRERADPDPRAKVLTGLAGLARRLHDAGLASPDLISRHVFLDRSSPEPGFCLIDMARLDQGRCIPHQRRARDLASLHVSIPESSASAREREILLRTYCGQDLPFEQMQEMIQKRVAHLLRQKRHRVPYFGLHLQPGFQYKKYRY